MNKFSKDEYLKTLSDMRPADVSPTLIHDLRNRINSIINAVSFLKSEPNASLGTEDRNSLIDAIQRAADDVSNIVEAYAEYHLQQHG